MSKADIIKDPSFESWTGREGCGFCLLQSSLHAAASRGRISFQSTQLSTNPGIISSSEATL